MKTEQLLLPSSFFLIMYILEKILLLFFIQLLICKFIWGVLSRAQFTQH